MVAATSGAFYLLALACPVSMGLMMLFMGKGMMGGNKKKDAVTGSDRDEQSVAELKAEQARLAEKISALETRSERDASSERDRTEETERTLA